MIITQSMLDKECYYLNLADANLNNKTNWQFEYSAKVGVSMGGGEGRGSKAERERGGDEGRNRIW